MIYLGDGVGLTAAGSKKAPRGHHQRGGGAITAGR